MSIRARLFDADGNDIEHDALRDGLDPLTQSGAQDGGRRLLWIDVDRRSAEELDPLAKRIQLPADLAERLVEPSPRPQVQQYPDRVHLTLLALEAGREPVGVDLIAGRDWVLSVHDGELPAIERILDGIEGESRLGALDAGAFAAAVVDSIIVGYFEVIEALDVEIDALDEAALDRDPAADVLERIVDMRRRISRVRRLLAPHREAFAVLDRPDMALREEFGGSWHGLGERFEAAMSAVERVRESLLGTFDIYLGRATQRDSEAMRILTILSAVLLPAVVLAGVMGMNFELDFFDHASNAWLVVGAMVGMALIVLFVARRRRWL